MNAVIFGFALVAIAALLVAAVSLTFAVKCNSRTRAIQTAWESSKPAKLAAELGALADALEAHRRSTRSELGRLWQRVPKPPRVDDPEPADDAPAVAYDLDPELAAHLAFQAAPTGKPNGAR